MNELAFLLLQKAIGGWSQILVLGEKVSNKCIFLREWIIAALDFYHLASDSVLELWFCINYWAPLHAHYKHSNTLNCPLHPFHTTLLCVPCKPLYQYLFSLSLCSCRLARTGLETQVWGRWDIITLHISGLCW